MEAWLYTILHVVFYITTGIALCGYMYLFTWQYCDGVSGDSFISLTMPTISAICTMLFAWATALTLLDDYIWIVIFADVLVSIGAIVSAWMYSVVRYRKKQFPPAYATFVVVSGYSLLVFSGSALLLILV